MSEARFVTVGNSTDSPLVIDRAGRTVPAHGFGTADLEQTAPRQLIDAGHLVVIDDPREGGAKDDEVNPEALAAFAATDARNSGDSPAEVAQAQTDAEVEAATADESPTTDADKPARQSRRPR